MKKQNSPQKRLEARLSPVYEKVILADGRGFAGFTVLYKDGEFENYVLFFNQNTQAEIVAAVKARHLQWSASAEINISEDLLNEK